MTTTTDRAPLHTPDEVPLRDVVAAAWTGHRRTLLATSVAVIVLAAVTAAVSRTGPSEDAVARLLTIIYLYPLGVGVFQAAPLVAREYEQGTHRWAWSQDVSATRWLLGTATLFAAFATASSLLLGFAAQDLVDQLPGTHSRAFETGYFDASPLVQVGHVVFALALGVALGVLVRRSVLAMVLSLVAFLVSRAAVMSFWRPSFLPPLRQVVPIGERGGFVYGDPQVGLVVRGGLVGGRGIPTPFPAVCRTTSDWQACLTGNGITGTYLDYQPMERLGPFHLIEAGLFGGAALVLMALAWGTLHHRTR